MPRASVYGPFLLAGLVMTGLAGWALGAPDVEPMLWVVALIAAELCFFVAGANYLADLVGEAVARCIIEPPAKADHALERVEAALREP